jgi:haloacetate dehalogenase
MRPAHSQSGPRLENRTSLWASAKRMKPSIAVTLRQAQSAGLLAPSSPAGNQPDMLRGFDTARIETGDIAINVARGGEGPPLLLIHGYPQTHVMWHRVAPVLAEFFTVVCTDLRGYGDSDKPPGGGHHNVYSKRTMARDQIAVMRTLGYERFAVAAHDRGARVALRMALDHAACVSRLAILDIVPTKTIYETIDQARATNVWRCFFLIQPHDLPERLIRSDPRGYLHWTLEEWCGTSGALDERAVAEYERCFDKATIHATCEDYRAGASIDLAHDTADPHQCVACPTLVLCSKSGIGRAYDVPKIWRQHASRLTAHAIDCGHFLAEERPTETAQALLNFLAT